MSLNFFSSFLYFFLINLLSENISSINERECTKFISFKDKMKNWFFPNQKWETNYSLFSFSYERYQIFIDLLNSFSSIDRLLIRRKKKELKIKDYSPCIYKAILITNGTNELTNRCAYTETFTQMLDSDINFNRSNYQILFALQWLGKYQTILENLRYILSLLYFFNLLNLLFNLTNFTYENKYSTC